MDSRDKETKFINKNILMSKRIKELSSKIDKNTVYSLEEGIKLVKETSTTKFDPSIEVHFKLGIDPKQSDQQIRTSIALPHGTGKKIKILAIVPESMVKEAKAAGAEAGSEEMIDKIEKSKKCDYDLVITSPEMMPKLAKIAKILGPKGLMPNPKTETVTPKVAEKINEFTKGRVNVKNDDTANLHAIIGKASFTEEQLLENCKALNESLLKLKPSSLKGVYIKGVSISSSMGPGIKVKI